jgi:hypothetical protein
MIKKLFFSASATTLILFSSCSVLHKHKSPKALPGTWQSTPIAIDGDSKDWPSPYPNYDAKALIGYATSNDKHNLYITMEAGDELTQLKVLKKGMVVSIDTGGQKDGQMHINYPLENDDDPLDMVKQDKSSYHYSHIDHQFDAIIEKSLRTATQLSLDGFISGNGGFTITQQTPSGIKVRAKIDEYRELVWEAVVPFKAIYGTDTITAAQAGKPISVCFAIKGYKKPDTKGNDNMSGGSNNSMQGMGGGRSNAMRGGGGGASPRAAAANPMENLYESSKTWKQFGIAFQ